MKRKNFWLIGICLAIGTLLSLTVTPYSALGAGPLKGEVMITVSSLSDEVLHPHLISKSGGNYPVGFAMHQGLTKFPTKPGLAESWTTSADGLTWTFKIRKNVKFHNGDSLTAEDAKYGFDMCLRPEVPNQAKASIGKYIKSVEIADKYTLVITLTNPFPDLLYYLFMDFQPLPKAYIEKVGEDVYKNNPVGTGPFKLVNHVRNDYIEFEGFEGYWGDGPYIKKLTIKIIPEASTRLAMLKTKTCDISDKMIGNVGKQIQDDPKLRIISGKETGCLRMELPAQLDPKSPIANKKVRQAISYAIDREGLAQAIFLGEAVPIYTDIIPTWNDMYDPAWKPLPYDPEKAKKLLAEAGYKKGFEIDLVAGKGGSAPFAPEVAEAIAGGLLHVGIKCNFREFEPGIYWGKLRKKEFKGLAMFMHQFIKGPYRDFSYSMTGFQFTSYSNKWFDEQVGVGIVMLDEEARAAHARKLVEFLNAEVANIPIVATNLVAGVGPKVVDWMPYSGSAAISGFESIKVK